MPRTLLAPIALLSALLAAAASPAAFAADDKPAADDTAQVVVPQVDRRDVKVPHIPSNDIEMGLFFGSYNTQNFGSSTVTGVRLGYHITEDVFVEGAYGQTKVSDENFRQILPGGVFPEEKEKLKYYNLSAGYNVLPGEVFFGSSVARPSAGYLIAGVGSTTFNDQRRQTINFGFGMRLFFNDHFAVQFDAREHIFSLDLLGKRQSTRNPELSLGVTGFF